MLLFLTEFGIDHVSLLAEVHATMDAPWESPWSEQSYHELISQPSVYCLAFLDEKKVASFIVYQSSSQEIDILYIATALSYRRQGLATQLIQSVMHQHKGKTFFLDVCEANTSALGMYKKLDFRQINRRKNYYLTDNNRHFDAVVLAYNPTFFLNI